MFLVVLGGTIMGKATMLIGIKKLIIGRQKLHRFFINKVTLHTLHVGVLRIMFMLKWSLTESTNAVNLTSKVLERKGLGLCLRLCSIIELMFMHTKH